MSIRTLLWCDNDTAPDWLESRAIIPAVRPDGRQWPPHRAVVVAVWIVFGGALPLLLAPRAIGHDQASLLEKGIDILNGAVPFRDIRDFNSPLIYYVNAIPAALGSLAGTNVIPWFTALTVVLAAWSALLADRVLLAISPAARWVERFAVMLVPLGPCSFHLTITDPGQREHLFLLLYFPFLLSRVAASRGLTVGSRAGRFLIGVAGAIGVGMKPYFLLPALTVEAVLLVSARTPRVLLAAEVGGALSTAAACAVGLLLLPAAAWEALTGQILPLVRHGYAAIDTTPSVVVLRAIERLLLALPLAIIAWRAGPVTLRPAVAPIAALCLGSVAAAWVQGKGFGYHFLAADAALLFLVATAALALARGRAAASVRLVTAAAIAISAMAWRPLYAASVTRTDAYPFRRTLEQYARPGDPIIVLSTTTLLIAPSALQLDLKNVARQSALFLALALRADAALGTGGAHARRVAREIAEDIRVRRPVAIFIDRSDPCFACPPGFRMDVVARTDPDIRKELDAYRYEGVAQNVDVYRRR